MEEKKTNWSTFVGMGLIFLLMYLWMQYATPPKTAQQTDANAPEKRDSIPQGQQTPAPTVAQPVMLPDSQKNAVLAQQFGVFAPAAAGTEKTIVLENDLLRVTLTSKGGRIKEVLMKQYEKINSDTAGNDFKSPVYLLEDEKNRFEYRIPVQNAAGGAVNTADLYFTATQTGQSVVFRADAGQGRSLEQTYTLLPDNYQIDYKIAANGLQQVLPPGQQFMTLNWVNYLDKIEKNQQYERTYSSVYFKEVDNEPDYCNCREDDVESLGSKPVKWFSHSHQFFNTSIVANDFAFREFTGETKMFTDFDQDLKLLKTSAQIPLDNPAVNMTLYIGQNAFERLLA